MVGLKPEAEFGAWRVEGRSPAVEYSLAVLDEILGAVLQGFQSFPYGGVEVGGVLFGSRQGDLVRILAWRPIRCEYATGPGFVLSAEDEQALEALLESSAQDGSLRGLVPVGWYHSHTRSGLCLTDQDIEIYNRHFPEHWQVAMLLQPQNGKRTRVGFFIREPDGIVRTEASYQEFEAGPIAEVEPPASREEAPVPARSLLVPVPPAQEVAEASAGAEPVPVFAELASGPGKVRKALMGLLVALCLALIGAGLLASGYWRRWITPTPLSVRVVEKNGRLEIQWDPGAEAVRAASRGSIEVQDGAATVVIPLDAAALRSGSWPVARRSEDVGVRLKVHPPSGEPVLAVARFLGRPGTGGASAAPGLPPSGQVRGEVEQLRAEKDRLDRELKKLAEPGPVPPVPKATARPKRMLPVPAQTASRRQPAEVPSPPLLAPQPLTGSSPPQVSRPVEMPPPPPPAAPERTVLPKPAPPAEAPKSTPAYRGPASGKLIWTGFLQKNSVLSIEGRRASTGQLTGDLPSLPVRIGAHPAELSGRGLTVFSSNPKYSHGPVAEPPGPQNGWNRTVYRYDPVVAQDLVVVETPNPEEGRNRILLRSGERPVSVILIEWEVIR